MAERAHVGAGIAVRYDRARCRHVAECVRGLPLVFDPGRRPWIVVDDESDALLVAGVVRRCPTDPLLVRGDLRLDLGEEGGWPRPGRPCAGAGPRPASRSVTDHEPSGGRPHAESAVPEA